MTFDAVRRTLLAALPATVAFPFKSWATTARLCPNDPSISSRTTPLTIDVHAHFFNGSDLQIKRFLSATTIGPKSELRPLINGAGALLQTLGWHIAPSAQQEMRAMSQYSDTMKNCEGSEQLRRAAAPSFREGYEIGRRELQTASNALYAAPAGATVLGPRSAPGSLGSAIAALPSSYDEFQRQSRDGTTTLGSNPTPLGYIQFLLHNFNYRHVNAIDYLTTYSKGSSRKIDLVVPSLVDYDWWLAGGDPTPTSLDQQVDLMRTISILLQGRVHGFVAFCPFREAMTRGSDGTGASMRLVKRAIESEGFVGVKLYPPMGFAPWGNSELSIWQGKPNLPSAAAEPDFGKKLDVSMEALFRYCIAKDVPVMAHTNHSNGPNEEFMSLAGSKYWSKALDKFTGLRVNFGHFGDTDVEDDGKQTREFLRLFTSTPGSSGTASFADTGYYAGVLLNQGRMRDALVQLYSASKDHILRERLMYGSDWTMILPQQNVERYLSAFIDVVRKVENLLPDSKVRQTTLSNAFFGANAVDFLGLAKGMPNRRRLEVFYEKNGVPEPDWMVKIG
jgi:predicted TIM-barrel fold metal-dependent hydrolase